MASKPNGCKGGCGIQIVWDDAMEGPVKFRNALQGDVAIIEGRYTNNPDSPVGFRNGAKHECPLYVKGAAPGTYTLIELLGDVNPVWFEERKNPSNNGSKWKSNKTYSTTNTQTGQQEISQEQKETLVAVQCKSEWSKDFKNLETIAQNGASSNSLLVETNNSIAKINENLDLLAVYLKALPGNIAEAIALHGKPPAVVKSVKQKDAPENSSNK
jgi:hypothetical protein